MQNGKRSNSWCGWHLKPPSRIEQGTRNTLSQKTNRPVVPRRTDEVDGDTMPIHTPRHTSVQSRGTENAAQKPIKMNRSNAPTEHQTPKPTPFFHTRSSQSRPVPTPNRRKSKPLTANSTEKRMQERNRGALGGEAGPHRRRHRVQPRWRSGLSKPQNLKPN